MIRYATLCAVCFAFSALADLSGDIDTVLADKYLAHVATGIEIVKLGDKSDETVVLYQHNPTQPLIPASNLKVITSSAALDALGPDFHYRTLLVRHGHDLALIGDGDPTIGDVEYLRKLGWDATTLFRDWAEVMKKKGITQIDRLLIDDSVFEEVFFHPHWPQKDSVNRFSAEIGGLNLNANCIDFYFSFNGIGESTDLRAIPESDYLTVQNRVVGGHDNDIRAARPMPLNIVTFSGTCPQSSGVPVSITVHDPPLFTGAVLAETLKANGIQIHGAVKRDRTVREALAQFATHLTTAPATQTVSDWQVLAVHETPILAVIARANKDSMNLYAECLCKRLGFAVTGQSGSWTNGPATVEAFLQKIGVPSREFHLEDGCGLSHQDTISANTMVQVLNYDYFSKNRQAYLATLSVAGSDGTLKNRFEGSDLRGRVFGKSGFVEGVSSLSGFVHAKDDRWYAFAILMNGIPPKSNSIYKTIQEAVIRAIDSHVEKSINPSAN